MRSPVAALLLTTLLAVSPRSSSALPTFSGAEGFGSTTPGGRGGAVVAVTSLADAGMGTPRAAFEDATGPRTVVFRVSGTIALASPLRIEGEADIAVAAGWKTAGTGYSYRSKSGALLDVTSLMLRPGAAGQAKLALKGKGAALTVPTLPLAQDPTVTGQLESSTGVCSSQTYAGPARRNDASQFKDAFS